ncbi:hypothetical protein AAC691_00475 [Nguyenibacter vanlangensis]|uniref:Glucose-methanol-choline oxidoreductase N-terminal domain-containing protein n=1 Tax=Nguyenibacter vanlangensis TaxID=1216886 RepID=A0ABZ3D6D9_9PROT
MKDEEAGMYNFIVVGAGSAGCVTVNRLSADGHFRVCLIKAGSDDRIPRIRIPAEITQLIFGQTLRVLCESIKVARGVLSRAAFDGTRGTE